MTNFGADPEHSPMSGIDEYLVHNYPHPVRVMWTTDAQAYERGMDGGPNGGTPDGDLWHGAYVGDNVVTGETYDANDPDVRAHICGLDQHQVRFECNGEVAYGVFEAYDTLAYDTAVKGKQGLSLLE
jgi:hypothetical protein